MSIKKTKKTGFEDLSKVFKNHPKNKELQEAYVRHKVLKIWGTVAESFFESAKEFTYPVDFKKGILYIACLSKELGQKIKLFSKRIVYALNQILKEELVYSINIEI